MTSLFSSTVRSGLLALGVISGLSAPSMAGPIIQPNVPLPANAAPEIIPVRDGWAGGNNNGAWQWRHNNGRHWNGGGNWNSRRHWRGHGRYYGGRYYGGGGYYDDGGAAILGLGLGLGLGAALNNGYYDAPPPRRYYRAGRLSSAHVQWCYNRYRSYRAYDNSFQPYNGPRQQCYSPYS